MNLSERVKEAEGLRLKPYRCPAGKLTIGYGRNLEDRGITEAEAEHLLENDLDAARWEVQKRVPGFADLSLERRNVLVEMAFNLGIGGVMRFTGMLAAIRLGDYETAAVEMLDSKWAKQVGRRARMLATIMETGSDGLPIPK